jgi:ESS family glutamate:Na+ symporter
LKSIPLTDLQTLVISLTALILGTSLTKKLPWLGKLNLPCPVLAGLFVALTATLIRTWFDAELVFASRLTDILLLTFFTTVGLTAKFSALKAGGKPLVLLCVATLLLIVVQNIAGIAVALGFGAHPYYGLLVGSISFVGGPGTAAAWAKEAPAGVAHAPEVAIAGATFAVIVGALVAGPITGWIVERHRLESAGTPGMATWVSDEGEQPPERVSMDTIFHGILLILVSVLIGQSLNAWATGAGMVMPGFLTAMLGGALITNLADVFGKRFDIAPIEGGGEVALQTFLVMYLMSLKLWTLGSAVLPLLVNVVVQVILASLIAYFVLFRLLGRDYDAAITVGGFLGFGLSSMTVGMASMDRVASRYGPSPKAFLLVTLAGTFFVDLANAFLVKGFLLLPIFNGPRPQ